MKGLKCCKICPQKTWFIWFSWVFLLASLSSLIFCFRQVNAAQVYTRSFGIQGYSNASHEVVQERGILYNMTKDINATSSSTGYNWLYNYDWLTPVITLEGTNAAFYWETNIVAQARNMDFENPFRNLELLHILSCGSHQFNQSSVSYVVTPWWDGQYRKYTLTIYAAASLSGFSKGQSDDIRCTVGTDTTSPFIPTDTANVNHYQIYFEKQTTNYVFSDSMDNSLLQTLIDQNSTFFQQNINTYNMQKDEFDQTQDAINDPAWVNAQQSQSQDQADDVQNDIENNQDIASISGKTTNLLGILTSVLGALSSPVISTCILPMDFTNYTGAGFYEVDLCHLSPPTGVTNVLNVIFIFFVATLAYTAVRTIINLYREVFNT